MSYIWSVTPADIFGQLWIAYVNIERSSRISFVSDEGVLHNDMSNRIDGLLRSTIKHHVNN